MAGPSQNPWYENPRTVGVILILMLLLVLLVWLLGVGAAFMDSGLG
ncbi:MAG: hypothetical protein ACYC1C_10335 [Chloroflexota bacterium]